MSAVFRLFVDRASSECAREEDRVDRQKHDAHGSAAPNFSGAVQPIVVTRYTSDSIKQFDGSTPKRLPIRNERTEFKNR